MPAKVHNPLSDASIIALGNAHWLKLDGSNANQHIDILNWNLSTGGGLISRYVNIQDRTADTHFYIDTYSAISSTHNPILWMRRSRSNSMGVLGTTLDGDRLGQEIYMGVNAAGTPIRRFGALVIVTQEGDAGVNVPTKITYLTYTATGQNAGWTLHADNGFEHTGDFYFTGTGSGFLYGHMYTNATIATTLTNQNTWYELDGATAWTAGLLNNCTFTDPGITVLKAGVYEVTWSLSTDFSASPGAKQNIEYGVMINGAIQNEGQASRTLQNSTDTGNACGLATLDLAANAVISLGARNITSAGKILHVEHGNMAVKMVGGT